MLSHYCGAALVKTQLGRAINILDVFKLQLSQGFICSILLVKIALLEPSLLQFEFLEFEL